MKQRAYQKGIIISLFVLFFVLFVSEKAFADATTNPRVQFSDLQYLGAFRMPQSQNFAYANDGMAYNTVNNSLFVKCMGANFNDTSQQKVAEVSIPTLVNSTNINSLNAATIRQNCADITENHLNPQNITNGMVIGGLLDYNNKLIGSEWAYYDGASEQTTSHFYHSLTLSQTGTYHGQYGLTVSPVYSGFVGGYMATIPSEWQSLLGGPALTGSCCHAIISHQSTGPSVWVFDPDNLGVQSPVPATPLVYYTLAHPTLGTWGHPLPPNPVYNIMTMITGIVFPSGTRSVMLFGRTGLGDQCYGGTIQAGTGVCDDPIYPQDKGTHAYPYAYYVWMYDANDFLAVKNGTKNPWDITPYFNGQLTLPFTPGDNQINGAAYDPVTKRIYISQRLSDNSPSYGFPIIHAFSLNTPTTPDTTPPTLPSNFNLAATATSQSSITVSWNPATDDVGVDHYEVERCLGLSCTTFANVGNTTASPFIDSGLTPSTGYSYHVRALDAAGNMSGWSNVVGATTQAPDTTPPTAPTSLSAIAPSSSTIDLTWTASTDNVGVTGYKVERCSGASCTTFTQVGTPTTNSYSDTGLTASTTYRYQVRAVDGAGYNSAYSSIVNVTTSAPLPNVTRVGSPIIQNIGTNNTGSISVTIPSGTNYMTIGATTWSSGSGFFSNGSVKLGGISFSLIASADADNNFDFSALFGLKAPALGNQTLSWDWSGTGSATNHCYVVITFYKDVDQVNPVRSSGSQQGDQSSNVSTGTMTAQTGDIAIAVLESDTSTVTWGGATQSVFDANHIFFAEASPSANVMITASGVKWGAISGGVLASAPVQPSSIPTGCNTVTTTNFSQAAYNSYGAPFDAFQTSTNLLGAKCTSADTHTINLTTGVTGDTTRIVYTKGYYYDPVTAGWTQYSGTCNGALNGEWCQGSVSATITNPNISTASASNPTYVVGMTCSVQGGSWKCGCRDTTCSNFYWQVQGAGQ